MRTELFCTWHQPRRWFKEQLNTICRRKTVWRAQWSDILSIAIEASTTSPKNLHHDLCPPEADSRFASLTVILHVAPPLEDPTKHNFRGIFYHAKMYHSRNIENLYEYQATSWFQTLRYRIMSSVARLNRSCSRALQLGE